MTINSVVIYGKAETIASKFSKNNISLGSTWNSNCFGLNLYAYYTDDYITRETRNALEENVTYAVGDMQHEYYRNSYSEDLLIWMDSIGLTSGVIRDLGIETEMNKEAEIFDKLGVFRAARDAIKYELSGTEQDPEYIISADFNFSLLPDLSTIANTLKDDYNDNNGNYKTVGAGIHSVNPINGSRILYMDKKHSTLFGHSHTIQQFLSLETFRQVLNNIVLMQNTLHRLPEDGFKMLATHLGIEIRYLEDEFDSRGRKS